MQLLNWETLKAKLQSDYDIQDENFVDDEMLVGYVNEALDDAETAIHTLHYEDKYFLTHALMELVTDQQYYSLPADIYGNKIRLLFYDNGSLKYPVTRIRRLEEAHLIQPSQTTYRYLITNDYDEGIRVRFYPTIAEDSTDAMNIWYIRNMRKMTDDVDDAANICEIPECVNFVYQHVRKSIAKKSRLPGMIAQEDADLKIQYALMCDALKDMTSEEDNQIPLDVSSYISQDLMLESGGY